MVSGARGSVVPGIPPRSTEAWRGTEGPLATSDKDRDRTWDDAAIVDRLLRQLRRGAPAPVATTSAGVPRAVRPGPSARPVPATARAAAGPGRAAVWGRIGLGVVLGLALTQWPYSRACGWPLLFYLGAVGVLLVVGLRAAAAAWTTRLAVAHTVALLTLLWGLALTAHEVLPRVGYARGAATWTCAAPRVGS